MSKKPTAKAKPPDSGARSARYREEMAARETVRTESNILDLEFSDYGRDSRFVSGWWFIPIFLIGLALLFLSLVLLF